MDYMKIGDRIFIRNGEMLNNVSLSKEPFLFIEEVFENGVLVMGGSREDKEFLLNRSFSTSPTKINTNKPLYKKGSQREMQREYARLLNKIY